MQATPSRVEQSRKQKANFQFDVEATAKSSNQLLQRCIPPVTPFPIVVVVKPFRHSCALLFSVRHRITYRYHEKAHAIEN